MHWQTRSERAGDFESNQRSAISLRDHCFLSHCFPSAYNALLFETQLQTREIMIKFDCCNSLLLDPRLAIGAGAVHVGVRIRGRNAIAIDHDRELSTRKLKLNYTLQILEMTCSAASQ